MRTRRMRIAMVAVAVVALAVLNPVADEAPAGFAWETDLARARTRARATGRPLMLVFR